MTPEVAEFLRHKFLKSIHDAGSELSDFIFIPYFAAIKCFVEEIKINPAIKTPLGVDLCLKAVSLLYELNDALADCRVFANECKHINKKLLHFNPFMYCFIRKMKKRLHAMKCKFAALVEEEKFYSTLVLCDQTSIMADRMILIGDQNEVVSPEPKVIRSDEHAEDIEGLLFGGDGNGFTAIGIVGIAGVGKTTLVHLVLNRQRVKDEFSPIIWLCLSDIVKEKDVFTYRVSIRIVTCILLKLGEMGNGNGAIVEEEGDISNLGSLTSLLERLNELLSGRRYLIVLDDVWHINNFYSDLGSTFQDRLSHALPRGRGGAVIVTTRIPEVAQHMVGTRNMILVKPLDRESCWRIFLETIKDNKEVLHMSTHETLEKIKNEIKDQCYGLPLAAKELAGIIPKRIRDIESNRFLKEMYIPDELLQPDLDVEPAVHIPKFPVLVFIDMKSKQPGEKLLDKFRYHLNKKQVFAVFEENSDYGQKIKADNPERVLKDVYSTLEKLKRKGYAFADGIQKTMTIIIVGQDSVANWILGVICDLKLPELPSIAPIPLGDSSLISGSISKSFGWKCISHDNPTLIFSLEDVQRAEKMKTDSWHVLIRMKATQEIRIPHSLHLFRPVHEGNMQNADKLTLFGGFWNYFSLEYVARRGCGNHCFQPTQRTLSSVACIKVMKQLDQWDTLDIPSSIKSILCLNLPRTEIIKKERKERDLIPSVIDDRHLEIIGYRDVFFPLSEGSIHLDQVRGLRFEFIDGEEEVVKMTIDGAPWENIPIDGTGITVIEITHHCQVNILANPRYDCPLKSIHDSSPPDSSENDDENNAKDYHDRHKKFGAASTFKLACADEGQASTSNVL
ncbi:uncharacterized protein LOC133725718 [Rosa rugosa]|uniref:uncharacterized protein LOC133725718 n=1 Tax=Rosa rugosa TaxID=74645 RepID=UPI002B4075AD|nr:uncharacterized protein LOC133725718 [Rosa rugosa]